MEKVSTSFSTVTTSPCIMGEDNGEGVNKFLFCQQVSLLSPCLPWEKTMEKVSTSFSTVTTSPFQTATTFNRDHLRPRSISSCGGAKTSPSCRCRFGTRHELVRRSEQYRTSHMRMDRRRRRLPPLVPVPAGGPWSAGKGERSCKLCAQNGEAITDTRIRIGLRMCEFDSMQFECSATSVLDLNAVFTS